MQTETEGMEAQTTADETLTSAATSGSEAWIETQAELLERLDEISRGWVQRRRDALEAARQSLEEMRNCRDVNGLLRIQRDWVAGALKRAASDFEAMTGILLSYSRGAMARFGDTARSLGEEARHSGAAALSTAGAKPERAHKERDEEQEED